MALRQANKAPTTTNRRWVVRPVTPVTSSQLLGLGRKGEVISRWRVKGGYTGKAETIGLVAQM